MTAKRAWTLPAAAGLAALEAAFLIAVVVFAGHRRTGWALFLAIKFVFCRMLLSRSPGAFFAVLLYELAGLGVALFAPRIALPLRIVEATVAATTLGLLFASAHLFPTSDLRPPGSRP